MAERDPRKTELPEPTADDLRWQDGLSCETPGEWNAALLSAVRAGGVWRMAQAIDGGADVNCNDGAPLSIAAANGDVAVVDFLLERGAETGDALAHAAGAGQADMVEHLLSKGASVDDDGQAVFKALGEGHPDIVVLLLAKGADANARGNGYLLLTAVMEGDAQSLDALVEHGADVNAGNGKILQAAIKAGQTGMMKRLVEEGADIDAGNGEILMEAVRAGDAGTVDFLIAKGVDVTAQDHFPLAHAATLGHLDIVEKLADAGGDIHARADCALRFAAQHGRLDALDFLIQRGADVTAQDNYAIKNAAQRGHADVVARLLECGADPSAQDNLAFADAVTGGHNDVAVLLIEHDPELLNNQRAFCLACRGGNTEMARYMLENGASADAYDFPSKKNVISLMARWGKRDIVELLIEHGANVNADDSAAMTAAIMSGEDEIAQLLYDKGSGIGREALTAAIKKRRADIFESLLRHAPGVDDAYLDTLMELNREEEGAPEITAVLEKWRARTRVVEADPSAFENRRLDELREGEPNGLVRAALSDHFNLVSASLKTHGEKITRDDLVESRDEFGNSALDILGARGRLHQVFDAILWRGRADEMNALWRKDVPRSYRDKMDFQPVMNATKRLALREGLRGRKLKRLKKDP